ncbi:MAG: hypothetical protein ACTSRK_19010, partial [Promethearchaeota archaeon]
PYANSNSIYPSNPFQSHGFNNVDQSQTPYPEYQSRMMQNNTPNYPSMEDNYSNRMFNRPSVHKLIPVKSRMTAGIFRNQIENSWIKVLMVAIDGRKTLNNLAELLDISLSDIIQACEYLERNQYITFKQ